MLTVGQKSGLHLCSSLNSSLSGSWAGLDSSKVSDFHVLHNTHFPKNALGVGPVPPSMKKPWKTCCGSAGEDHIGYCQHVKILLMWRQEGEQSWQSCWSFQLRNLVNKALNNCTYEKGFEMKIWEASSKEKLSLFAWEEMHSALPRLRSGLRGTLFEALSEEISCFV